VSIAILCGGLGGSRFVDAASRAAGAEEVTAIVNVGDDVEILGLHVSPDLDTVLYTLAGLLDEERGWGARDETYNALAAAGALGVQTWFTLGDRDIGLHLVRTRWLRAGVPLSEVTRRLAEALGIRTRILPVTDERLRTVIETVDGVLEAIAAAELVVIAPSNPFVSIAPILAVPGVREALARKRVAAVSPLVAGKAFRGPLAEMMESLGHEPSAAGIAGLYGDLVDVFVVAPGDDGRPGTVTSDIDMVRPDVRADVGRALLEALR
jgi:LPPG:FO 2-phospho-L-lactate transferase